MADEVTVYKDEDFKERVSKSVRANIGMLIPEDEFDALVQEEVKSFFEEQHEHIVAEKETSGWKSKKRIIEAYKMTPFRKMIWDEVKSQMKDKVKENFEESEVAKAVDSFWDRSNMQKFEWNEFVTELTKEVAPLMAEKMFERIVAEAVQVSSDEVLDKIQNY